MSIKRSKPEFDLPQQMRSKRGRIRSEDKPEFDVQ
jgi:hypothetical protein